MRHRAPYITQEPATQANKCRARGVGKRERRKDLVRDTARRILFKNLLRRLMNDQMGSVSTGQLK